MVIKPAATQQVQTLVYDHTTSKVSLQPGSCCHQKGDSNLLLLPPAFQSKGQREAKHLHEPALKANIVSQQQGRPGTATLPRGGGKSHLNGTLMLRAV